MISNWMAALPPKARPDRMPRIYITKPLPIPQRFFQTRQKYFETLVKERKLYIAELVKAVKSAHIGFINANLTHEDGDMFERIAPSFPRHSEKFILNPKGLTLFWKNISQNLYNLAWDAAAAYSNHQENKTAQQQQDVQQHTVFSRLGKQRHNHNQSKFRTNKKQFNKSKKLK